MPDVDGLAALASAVGGDDVVLDTISAPGRAELYVRTPTVVDVLETLRGRGYDWLMSLHGLDYYPEEPRFGVCYELLSMQLQDRVTVKVRVPLADPTVPSIAAAWPTADFQEREAFDMFGIEFEGHDDLRRILLPEDYIGHPQRRDFPVGGEPILFTGNETDSAGWWR